MTDRAKPGQHMNRMIEDAPLRVGVGPDGALGGVSQVNETPATGRALERIPGFRETLARLEEERCAWAANADGWSKSRAEYYAKAIDELHALDPRDVARIDPGRNGRGDVIAEITRTPAPRKRAIQTAPAAAKRIKRIVSSRDAAGRLVAEVFEGDGPLPAPEPAAGEKDWVDEYDAVLGGEGKGSEIFNAALKRVRGVYRHIKEQVPDAALRSVVTGLYAETFLYLHVLNAHRNALAERVAALETTKMEFCGAFEAGKAYSRGAAVQHKGHLWLAIIDTGLEPGGNQDWRLIVRGSR